MTPENTSKEVTPLFMRYWNKALEKDVETTKPDTAASFKKSSSGVNFVESKPKKVASILPPLIKAFGPVFLFGSCLKLAQDLLTFVSPQVLK
jgi:ATP-binding cassette subfamily C (CFTR/MRP) protein 1